MAKSLEGIVIKTRIKIVPIKVSLHPSIGIARLGNSPGQICLSPDSIDGLPYEADKNGNRLGTISTFKDAKGLIKRQGQPFRIIGEDGVEITLGSPNIASIGWTVHLANKKAAWYQYTELQGNLLYGAQNSYEKQKIALRNPEVVAKTYCPSCRIKTHFILTMLLATI